MFKPVNISLRRSFSIIFEVQLLMIIGLGILILLLYQNQNRLAKSRDTSLNSYLLADELRQSSDDLTRMARAYVATGNPEFASRYWTILDIRNGTRPRPLSYNRIYWDLVVQPGQKPRVDGPTISLHDLMVREGFTGTEFDKLTLAQDRSDALVKTEMIAMNAVQGLFDDGTGNFTVHREPDLVMANELMNNQAYYEMKAAIMQPIDDFYNMFEGRTTAAVAHYLKIAQTLFMLVIALALVILIISSFSYAVLRRQIVERESAEKNLVEVNKNLENQVRVRTKILERSEAELKKALAVAERTNKLMVGRELKMIELKKQLLNKPDET